jgi:type I restriction-modification system, S subunit
MSKVEMMSAKGKKKGALVPHLRFPEFRDAGEWAKILLSKIAVPVSERATDEDTDDVLTLSAEHGVVAQSAYFGKKVAGDDVSRYIRIKNNDFVYNDRTTKLYKYGTIKRLSRHTHGIVSPIYKCFRFNDEEIPVFWEWYFESGEHDAQLYSIINEGAKEGRFNIAIRQFLSTHVYFPNKIEQQKIADCLSSLDERIAAEANKLDALKAHKSGLLKQLFPAEGETLPALRFPEFRSAGEWKKADFGNIAKFLSGGTPSKDVCDYWGGDIPWISASSMHNIKIEKSDCNITKLAVSNGARIAPKGTLLLLVRGSMLHKRILLGISEIDVSFNQDVKALVLNDDITELYLMYFLMASESKLLATVVQTGIGAGKLDTDDLNNFPIMMPSPTEQQRISNCLSSLDELITAQTQKIDLLKEHKKGLMQQLFPRIDEVRA